MRKRSSRVPGLVLVALAGTLAFFRIPLASSQGITLISAPVSGALPVSDPDSALWQESTAIAVPLSAQNVTRPMLASTRVKSVTARALYNDSQLAILVEWADETQDDSMVRVQDFRDAVALQFPLAAGQPFFCMGQQGGNVNIWHWKADWQADITARQDMNALYPNMHVDQYPFTSAVDPLAVAAADYLDPNYLPALASGNLFASATRVSPVEDVIAGGFGSLTAQPADGQNVQGHGAWADGKWRVIFTRDLTSQEADDVVFVPGQVYSLAFAAWDGANGERNGQKSTSQWVSLQLGAPAAAPRPAETAAAPFDMLGMLYVFGPMVLVAGLITGLAGAVYLLSLLAKPADRS
jgi:hypothetical protein